jgi:hypothetical protein
MIFASWLCLWDIERILFQKKIPTWKSSSTWSCSRQNEWKVRNIPSLSILVTKSRRICQMDHPFKEGKVTLYVCIYSMCMFMYVCMYVCMHVCMGFVPCWWDFLIALKLVDAEGSDIPTFQCMLCTQNACMDVCVGAWTDKHKPWHFMFYHVYIRACMYMWMLAWIPCVLCVGGFKLGAIAEGTSHPETRMTRGGWPPETENDIAWRDLSIHVVTAQENIKRLRLVNV